MAVSFRVVGGPTPQTDNKIHTVTLTDDVAPGETLVLLVAHSVNTEAGTTGSVSDPGGGVWTRDAAELGGGNRGTVAYSSYCENGLSSGGVVGYYVKGDPTGGSDGTHMWHGMSPYALLVALNSGDGRRMVYDTSAVSGGFNVTRCPASGSLTSAADAVILAFHSNATSSGAGWWAQSTTGFTEIADAASGTESTYEIACDARAEASPWTGFSNGSPTSQNLSHILISYKAETVAETKTGRKAPTSAATVAESPHSGQNISNPGNVTADDGTVASITGSAWDTDVQSYVLKASGFDFSAVPDGATILGVVVRVNHFQSFSPPHCSIDLVQLLDATGAKVGDNKADLTASLNRPVTDNTSQFYAFGGPADSWGNSLTASWVKDPDFGVAVGYYAGVDNADLSIDQVTAEVFYTGGGGGGGPARNYAWTFGG